MSCPYKGSEQHERARPPRRSAVAHTSERVVALPDGLRGPVAHASMSAQDVCMGRSVASAEAGEALGQSRHEAGTQRGSRRPDRSGRRLPVSWRWRESNPRPSVMSQGFSGCSLLVAFSAPALTQASRRQAQPLFVFPTRPATGLAGGVSLRCQTPGRRRSRADRVRYSPQAARANSDCFLLAVVVCRHRIYEVTTTTLDPLPLARSTEVEAGHPHVDLSKPPSEDVRTTTVQG